MSKRFIHLPTKPTLIVPKDKRSYIRNQHYNPDRKTGKVYIDPDLHTKIKARLDELGILNKAYYVGGLVRDSLMGKPSKDIDIVVERPTQEDIRRLDKKLERTGKSFPVYRLKVDGNEIEIALARRERKTGKGHTGFEVQTGEDVTIKDDLLRRDLTINAMAISVANPDLLIDPYGGQKDLRNKILRHVSPAFAEDPLRVFRVARFAARFGFNVHPDTIALMRQLKDELLDLSGERIQMETEKAFTQSDKPSIYFDVLRKAGVLDTWFPEISKMIGISQPKKYHPEGDVYNHTMETIDNLRKMGASTDAFWGGLFHDVGKIKTPKQLLPKHYQHESRGLDFVPDISKRYRLSKQTTKVVKDSIQFHMSVPKFAEMKPTKVIQKVETMLKNGTLNDVIAVASADRLRSGGLPKEVFSVINAAKAAIQTKLPPDVVQKLKGKDPQTIKAIILEFRNKIFRQMLK